ncbi:hypothetical protein ALNOE001_12280 [Candidatus Methanobinarius endosymbioticus]|uniref:Uncharacterized protein n=1 Tax=Candidatus Methanobinarius endosymbioticus TaxID=2006182 RepID=A0A366M9R5_9EURY|nr:hypothetical protein ALNOE001_12280 [Candidatus Methanobinarius endosymbioticus]
MSMSKKIYYINSDPIYESYEEWLLEESSFVFLFMYGPSYKFDANNILNNTKANNDFKVTYCFGTYDDFLDDLNINFLGANRTNNTPHTFENTVVGSYFKADYGENVDASILNENMKNLFSYILYLLEETSTNQLNDIKKASKMDPSWEYVIQDVHGILDLLKTM